jgi:hypothetical protein
LGHRGLLADPARKVISVSGDGGFLFSASALFGGAGATMPFCAVRDSFSDNRDNWLER